MKSYILGMTTFLVAAFVFITLAGDLRSALVACGALMFMQLVGGICLRNLLQD